MLKYLAALAVAATSWLGTVGPSAAGCPGFGGDCGCAPAVEIAAPCGPVIESYLVNQGPVFSGPGHYRHQLADLSPAAIPTSVQSSPAIHTGSTTSVDIRAEPTVRSSATPMRSLPHTSVGRPTPVCGDTFITGTITGIADIDASISTQCACS